MQPLARSICHLLGGQVGSPGYIACKAGPKYHRRKQFLEPEKVRLLSTRSLIPVFRHWRHRQRRIEIFQLDRHLTYVINHSCRSFDLQTAGTQGGD